MTFTLRASAFGGLLIASLCTAGQAVAAADAAPWQSTDPAVRRQAAVDMGHRSHKAAAPALIALLQDDDKDVRREAAKALGQIKDPQSLAALVPSLRDSDKNVRFYAAYALGDIKDARSKLALLASLDDPEWCVRNEAAWALREIRDPAILAAVAAMLRNPQADSNHVGWILQQFDGEPAIEALADLLSDPSPRVRKRALAILVTLTDKSTFQSLTGAMKDADPEVRRLAVDGLARQGDPRAEQPLAELASRESNAAVQDAIQQALRRWSTTENLAGSWSFDDRNVKVARDVTDRGTDGEIQGAVPVEGRIGYALKFDGSSCVDLGKPKRLVVGKQPFTIMAWVKSEADCGVVVARGGAACGYSLYIKDGLPKFGIRCTQADQPQIAAGHEPVVGQWTHLAGVVNEDRIELYVNGRLAATTKTGGYLPGNCGQGMEIGFDKGNSAVELTDHFQGIIDEVRQFSTALTGEQIARQYRMK